MTTLTVKLDRALEQALARRSAERGVPKSVVVKRALAEYLAKEPVSAYEAGKELFGRFGSGEGDLSVRRREQLCRARGCETSSSSIAGR